PDPPTQLTGPWPHPTPALCHLHPSATRAVYCTDRAAPAAAVSRPGPPACCKAPRPLCLTVPPPPAVDTTPATPPVSASSYSYWPWPLWYWAPWASGWAYGPTPVTEQRQNASPWPSAQP